MYHTIYETIYKHDFKNKINRQQPHNMQNSGNKFTIKP